MANLWTAQSKDSFSILLIYGSKFVVLAVECCANSDSLHTLISMLEVNSVAPDFTLADHLGRQVSLSSFKGKQHVLLLFYPLDFTPT